MYSRRSILENNSLAHVFFRCHNSEFYLEPKDVKCFLLSLLAKYKRRHGIEIFEFIIMDNHAHLILRAKETLELGNFMRTVNSQLARYINYRFKRDSHALRERYKSPMISNTTYLLRTIQYVFLNRYKVNRLHPEKDPYCSASWRTGTFKPSDFAIDEEELILFRNLLDCYSKLPISTSKSTKVFVQSLIAHAIRDSRRLLNETFLNSHTVGDEQVTLYRGRALNALRRFSALRVQI